VRPSGTYAETLAAAWAAFLAPRAGDAPTVASTFSGGGGSSLGYGMAGFRELLAVEWDKDAAAVFAANFPGVALHVGDIWDVDPAILGLAPGELDVHDGSPPCTTFSTMRRRKKGGRAGKLQTDPKTELWRANMRLTEAWMPKVVLVENVAGMARGSMLPIYRQITGGLRALGYRVAGRLVDASWLGVPQARHRTIIIGVRDDLGVDPAHPAPFGPQVTVRQALAGLPAPGPWIMPEGKILPLVPIMSQGQQASSALRQRGAKGNHWYGVSRLAWDKPCRTVVAMAEPGYSGYLHPRHNRFLGLAELARIQSFPDGFDWLLDPAADNEKQYQRVHRLIGNSVPPLMMRQIAATIRIRVLDAAAR
jgi:DNA (cytosine-5)-methyltransferase 1